MTQTNVLNNDRSNHQHSLVKPQMVKENKFHSYFLNVNLKVVDHTAERHDHQHPHQHPYIHGQE